MRVDQGIVRKALIAFTALAMIAGVGLWLWNPEPDSSAREAEPAPGAGKIAIENRVLPVPDRSAIVAANIFSPARTPPERRYNPAADEFGDAPDPAAEMVPVEAVQSPPQLFGTVLGPGGGMALMQADSADGPARLFREGEKVGGYRLLKIKASSVVVGGPSGRLEIQVQRNSTGAK